MGGQASGLQVLSWTPRPSERYMTLIPLPSSAPHSFLFPCHSSNFADIFDLEHFMDTLSKDIHIVRQLPDSLADKKPYEMFPQSWSPVSHRMK